jgi:eukaryotic-like serine/threonine-protein kinase
MSLSPGTKFGPYEILAPLGVGGMGEVYRARDTRLGRDVAIKILPESFSDGGDRLRRFEQEAQAVAALNHPNILAVFDVGQDRESPFLVSELLEGDSLRATIDRGPLPQRKTIEYGVQIAQGLAAAHGKGIVHRDLKPENVFVTKDGRVKVLDFGLAKVAQKVGAASSGSDGITLTSSHTAAGVVMGTASYMAPEQVRGEPADARSDIFAFGAVMYEMLSGKRAFRRDTSAETMTAILREDSPEISDPGRPVSPALDRIVRRCLEKNPEQRFQSAMDLSFALSALSGTDTSAVRIGEARRKPSFLLWAAVATGLAIIGGSLIWLGTRHPAAVSQRMEFAIPVTGEVSHMTLSADGSTLAFVSPDEKSGIPMLYLQRVGSPDVRVLPGTEGANHPFWSPGGAYLAFFANGKLQKVAVAGGAPQALANVWAARGGSWGRRDVIIYEPDAGSPLWRINSDGSGAAPVTDHIFSGQDQSHRWPVFLPDGNHFLFWAGNFAGAKDDRASGIFASSLDGKERKLVTLAHSSFALDSSHLFYADDERHLVSVAFNPNDATLGGNATVIANVVAAQPATYWAALTAGGNGTLIYNTSTEAALSVLTWMDRSGKQLAQVGEPAVQCNPTLSPDGTRVAVDISDQKANNVDIWLESTSRAGNSRFTFDPSEEVVGVWARDGKTLAYRSAGGNVAYAGLVLKPANGLEREHTLLKGRASDDVIPNSWSPGDEQILFTHASASGYHLELLPAAGGSPVPFQTSSGNQTNGMVSPDGKWVAYASDESGTWEIYVTTFPGAAGKWQVSRGGGREPRWRGDGKEVFYLGATGMLTAVPVSTEGSFSTGTPTPLFQFHGRAAISSTDVFSYDVTKDGKRFLVNRYVKPEHISPLTIVLNASTKAAN